ncbi:probable RPL9A - ribosomal protein L9.e [Ustilago trichophora]|uniref:Probable RPL9A - ribosomal protein L9.e n=1 Tax=Ustilago trichophora TaxID=86804 RepID=A0A5C3EKT2_9BASI|nr:probable RPL9A - ribosomal protein L9.e [Ustilago trichophora]
MLQIFKELDLAVPADVSVSISSRVFTVKGPRGTLTKSLKHMNLDARLIKSPAGNKIKFIVWHAGRKHAACLRTAQACVANMIKGVTVGFQYKMRAVYAHFPINIIIAGDKKSAEIRNFLGEKRVRNIVMLEGVTIQEDKAQKDQVLVEGNDIDLVSQSAALLHGATLVRNKDIRKFLDGIYCTGKDTVVKAEA